MNPVLQPWHLLVVILAGWVNRRQQEVIDYLRTENQILKDACGGKRIRLTDGQRRLLAIKGKTLGRKILGEVATVVTPDTILRWHQRLVAMKWNYSCLRKRVGRPPVPEHIVELVLRIARENQGWGYDRIQGALANLGHDISDSTVGIILEKHGLEPAPERKRKTSWKEFIRAHWDVLGAVDFTTVEVWTKGGLSVPELERLHREIHEDSKIGMPRSDDLLRGTIAPRGSSAVPGPLPFREEPPGSR